ncbi:hypothetical protein KIPB_000027 [Kipferlia bialata]|uniref:Secreted protein n=1 Tax=Kipferlia bialata TaxID=797122 RepID=A0A9K3CPT5_9EUKA|nr:hypothetical protein KIPB_000027 [Kipferlia bialata]|eukprot:g27.t1
MKVPVVLLLLLLLACTSHVTVTLVEALPVRLQEREERARRLFYAEGSLPYYDPYVIEEPEETVSAPPEVVEVVDGGADEVDTTPESFSSGTGDDTDGNVGSDTKVHT